MKGDQRLTALGAATLVVSTLFPLVAGVAPAGRFPTWLGAVDVGLAALVMGFAVVIDARSRGRIVPETARIAVRWYRAFAAVPLVLLAVFLLAGDAVRWDVLMVGLAWRAAVVLHCTLGAVALWVGNRGDDPAAASKASDA